MCVMLSKVAMVSTVHVTDTGIYTGHFAKNFSNVNMVLIWISTDKVCYRNFPLLCAMKMSGLLALATLGNMVQIEKILIA
jgi:hypothetical protein